MVVFGDSSWVTSQAISRRDVNADLFDSCIGWLRGKSDLGKDIVPDKERPDYTLSTQKGFKEGSKLSRMVWLPLGLLFLSIFALGGGIWMVRRR